MLTINSSSEKSETIAIPPEEMKKFGFKDGDEVELTVNENDEIVLRSRQTERRKKILEATCEIIEERKSVLTEL